MNKTLRKVITGSSAVLMLAGVGASASMIAHPVHASRISRLRSRRSHDYRDIKSINAELSRLEHKRPRRSHHESLARWYKNNSHRMYWNDMHHASFHHGWDDGSDDYSYDAAMDPGGNTDSDRPNSVNSQYKHGWVVGYANNNGRKGRVKDYVYGLHYYNNGVALLKSSHTHYALTLNNGVWNLTE